MNYGFSKTKEEMSVLRGRGARPPLTAAARRAAPNSILATPLVQRPSLNPQQIVSWAADGQYPKNVKKPVMGYGFSNGGLGMQVITSPFYYAEGDSSVVAQGAVSAQASLPTPTAAPVSQAVPGDLLPKASEAIAKAQSVASTIAGVPVDLTTLAVLGIPFMMYGITGLLLAGGGLYLYRKQGK